MIRSTRREFLNGAAAIVASAGIGGPARAAMGPNDKFDLLVKGGDVLDPSQSLRGRRDIGLFYRSRRNPVKKRLRPPLLLPKAGRTTA